MLKLFNRCRYLLSLGVLALLVLPSRAFSGGETTPDGERIIDRSVIDVAYPGNSRHFFLRITVTAKKVETSYFDDSSQSWSPSFWGEDTLFPFPPRGREIVDAHHKSGKDYKDELLILLNNGDVYVMVLPGGRFIWKGSIDVSAGLPYRIDGDAMYVLTANSVFVNRDTSSTIWTIDTAGLGGRTPLDIAMDSSLTAYLATSSGLFRQGPDSLTWSPVNSFPAAYMTAVYVDHRDSLYASTFVSVYRSADSGRTWAPQNTGLAGAGVTKFGCDLRDNVYALAGGGVFRSDHGTAPWVRIDSAVSNMILDPISRFNSPFTSIGGDSAIFLGTNYGLFQSTDQGRTWADDNHGIHASTIFGFAMSPTRTFVSTYLGLFYRNMNDTLWTKAFPAHGYKTGSSIYMDGTGSLYTLGAKVSSADPFTVPTNWKSTDDGTSWLPDTAGLGVIAHGQAPVYFVDSTGRQHYSYYSGAAPFYQKAPGSPWSADTTGTGTLPANFPNTFGTDNSGNLYAAVTLTSSSAGLLVKRPIAGGAWAYDTAGLGGATIFSITPDRSGNLFAGTYGNGIYKRTGGMWASIPLPSGSGNSVFVTAMDKGGALFAGFSSLDGFNFTWHGVFFTTDDGSSWHYAGLDSIAVLALIARGDSIFAVTYYDGLYLLTRGGVTALRPSAGASPASFGLLQNYPNPFNPSTTIGYRLPAAGTVEIRVFDELGRSVRTLVHAMQNAGSYSVTWDGRNDLGQTVSSGTYFYRARSNNSVISKRMLYLK